MDDVSLSGESSAVMQVQQNSASEASNQASNDAAVDPAAKADSSSISSSTDAATAAVTKDGVGSSLTDMEVDVQAIQTNPSGQVQRNAASESSNQAMNDAAVDLAAKADSVSISSSTDAATAAVTKDGVGSSLTDMESEPIQTKLTAGDIFTLRTDEYILSDKPTVRKDCRVLRIHQHPRLNQQVQIWYSYTWTARNGVIHYEDDGELDISFQNGMSKLTLSIT